MRATTLWLGALLCAGLLAPPASGQHYYPRPPQYPPPQPYLVVPDACGPGQYAYCPNGVQYGPNYYLRPPFEPFQGFRPPVGNGRSMGAGPGQVAAPSHPYARSPRDFFMWTEAQQDLHTRERLLRFAP